MRLCQEEMWCHIKNLETLQGFQWEQGDPPIVDLLRKLLNFIGLLLIIILA